MTSVLLDLFYNIDLNNKVLLDLTKGIGHELIYERKLRSKIIYILKYQFQQT